MSFLKIAVTRDGFIPDEGAAICRLLDDGFDLMHIRKPAFSVADLRRLIESVPPRCHGRLILHDAFELTREYALGGVHLNSRNPMPPAHALSVSRSCHSIQELSMPMPDGVPMAYQTLSPIFDSFSKQGYKSRFVIPDVIPYIQGLRVVALGGVDFSKLPMLRESGFYGAAMLGAAWKF